MSNLVLTEKQKEFFKPVPIERLTRLFYESFREQGVTEYVTFQSLCRAFKSVSSWCSVHLISGDLIYGVRSCTDEINEVFVWEYHIGGPNVPLRFSVQEVKLDPRKNFMQGELTLDRCMQGIQVHLEKANDKIAQFNTLANQIKPILPKVDVDKAMGTTMEGAIVVMSDFYTKKYGGKPTMKNLRYSQYEGWVLSRALAEAQGCLTTNDSRLVYDVFEIEHVYWARIRVLYELRGLGVRFLVLEDDVNLSSQISGEDLANSISTMLTRVASGVRHWNWLVEGNHKKKSEVKNQWKN